MVMAGVPPQHPYAKLTPVPVSRMTEHELDFEVVCLARKYILRSFHFPDSRRVDTPGWPDRVLIGPHGVLFRELKTETGVLSRDQRVTGYQLTAAGLDFAVWRPSDLASGRIEAEMRNIA